MLSDAGKMLRHAHLWGRFSLTDLRRKKERDVGGRYRVGVLQKRGRSARRIARGLDLRYVSSQCSRAEYK